MLQGQLRVLKHSVLWKPLKPTKDQLWEYREPEYWRGHGYTSEGCYSKVLVVFRVTVGRNVYEWSYLVNDLTDLLGQMQTDLPARLGYGLDNPPEEAPKIMRSAAPSRRAKTSETGDI